MSISSAKDFRGCKCPSECTTRWTHACICSKDIEKCKALEHFCQCAEGKVDYCRSHKHRCGCAAGYGCRSDDMVHHVCICVKFGGFCRESKFHDCSCIENGVDNCLLVAGTRSYDLEVYHKCTCKRDVNSCKGWYHDCFLGTPKWNLLSISPGKMITAGYGRQSFESYELPTSYFRARCRCDEHEGEITFPVNKYSIEEKRKYMCLISIFLKRIKAYEIDVFMIIFNEVKKHVAPNFVLKLDEDEDDSNEEEDDSNEDDDDSNEDDDSD